MPASDPRRPRAAFTLLEVLIAAGLLGVVLGGAYMAMHTGTRGAIVGMAQDATLTGAVELGERLVDDLEQMVVLPGHARGSAVRISHDGQRLAFLVADRAMVFPITPSAFDHRSSRLTTGPADLIGFVTEDGRPPASSPATAGPQSPAGPAGRTPGANAPGAQAPTRPGKVASERASAPSSSTATADDGGRGEAADGQGNTTAPVDAWKVVGRPVIYRPALRPGGLFSPARNNQVMGDVLLATWRFAIVTSVEAVETAIHSKAAQEPTTETDGAMLRALIPTAQGDESTPSSRVSTEALRLAQVHLHGSFIDPVTGLRKPGATQDTTSATIDFSSEVPTSPAALASPAAQSSGETGTPPAGTRGLLLVAYFAVVDQELRVAQERTIVWDLDTARLVAGTGERFSIPPGIVQGLVPRHQDIPRVLAHAP